jgi:hypothetical protein
MWHTKQKKITFSFLKHFAKKVKSFKGGMVVSSNFRTLKSAFSARSQWLEALHR